MESLKEEVLLTFDRILIGRGRKPGSLQVEALLKEGHSL